ncbi:MAG: prepilin-type N-terminal cleavage/methylation domain-containing protein [Candidatus Moranbacteria bacterium]|nr:prepilin-type N-terminal cleavage/methylation domain-containing protein [Candidatus Moranbacteria bacterium]
MNIFFKKTIDKKVTQDSSGFTLLEILLVMFVVAFTFTGIYVILAKTAQHEKDNRYALIAANLAQEGVEIIRNRRDENLLNVIDMNVDLSSGICYPYWSGSQANCDNSREVEVEIDGGGVYRNCNGGCGTGVTIFERYCDINSGAVDMTVRCTVEWQSPSLGTARSIETESFLTNWQENT